MAMFKTVLKYLFKTILKHSVLKHANSVTYEAKTE